MTAEIIIVGGDSLIGRALADHLAAQGIGTCATTRRRAQSSESRPFLDLASWDGTSLAWLPTTCQAVLLAAAMTNQQACADNPSISRRINHEQPVRLARSLAERGIRLLFLSTSAVFDGARPHRRFDEPTAPLAPYGALKAETERMMLTFPNSVVLRLTKVLHRQLPLILRWRDRLAAGEPIEAFHDLYMAPIALADVTAALQKLIFHPATGVFHLSGRVDLNYWEFARRMAHRLDVVEALVTRSSIVTAAIDPAHAPRYTSLAMGEKEAEIGLIAPNVKAVLDHLV